MMYNKYTAGSRIYNGTSMSPHFGGGLDPLGYAARDKKYKTRKNNNALLRRIQARQQGRYISSDYLKPPAT